MNDEPNCWTCAYRDLPETAEPCASCDMYFSHFESSEPTESTDTAASEDARRCSLCKFRDTLLVQSPCQKCALTPGLPSFTSDTKGLVVYDEWADCAQFRHVYAQSTPGLVRLPHRWE